MADEIGISTKLGNLLPVGKMKDSGGKVRDQDFFKRKRKKSRGDTPPAHMNEDEEILDEEKGPPSGKILDITV
jgi:CHAD domain-containing protein